MDLGNKTIKDFKIQMKVEMTTPQEDTTLQALEATQEGIPKGYLRSIPSAFPIIALVR